MTVVDLIFARLGPCNVWTAETDEGANFLKTLPERFRAPDVTVDEGRDRLTGSRSEYDPATRSVATCPPLQTEIERLAADAGLRVREEN